MSATNTITSYHFVTDSPISLFINSHHLSTLQAEYEARAQVTASTLHPDGFLGALMVAMGNATSQQLAHSANYDLLGSVLSGETTLGEAMQCMMHVISRFPGLRLSFADDGSAELEWD